MTVVSNVSENGQPVGDHGDGELNWHTDLGFTDRPSGYTFLLAREVPPSGGNTSFANMYNAYERLPGGDASRGSRGCGSSTRKATRRRASRGRATATSRPAIRASCPVRRTRSCARIRRRNARRCISAGGSAATSPGLTLAESEALLDQLWASAALPQDVWTQQWQVGDLIIWDNRCTMHRRDAFTGQGRRRMHRLTTIGERPV